MATRTIAHVRSDADWEALYLDGKVHREGHRIEVRDAMELAASLGGPFEFRSVYTDTDYLDEHSSYPELLADVKEQ